MPYTVETVEEYEARFDAFVEKHSAIFDALESGEDLPLPETDEIAVGSRFHGHKSYHGIATEIMACMAFVLFTLSMLFMPVGGL